MRHFPACLDRAASDALLQRCRQGIAERGWGFWALERRTDGALLGLLGISPVSSDLPFAPAVEIGWRLDRPYWGKGYASAVPSWPWPTPSTLSDSTKWSPLPRQPISRHWP